jgi:hypothetical protein
MAAWVTAAVCGLGAAVLVATAVRMGTEQGSWIAGIAGGVTGFAGVALSAWLAVRPSASEGGPNRAEDSGKISVNGNVSNSAIGNDNTLSRSATAPAPPAPTLPPSDRVPRSSIEISIGGDANGCAIGKNNRVSS